MIPFYKNRIVAVADLVPYARNARTHSDKQVSQIARSIEEFGFTNPVLIDEAGGVIAGHGRILAARQLGMTKLPAVVVTGLSPARTRALVLADNKLALNAGWDNDLLKLELGEIDAEGDLDLTGFGRNELEALTLGDDELMEVGGGEATALTRMSLKWGDKVVPLSDQEAAELDAAFDKHYAENGVAFGFVRRLLGNV